MLGNAAATAHELVRRGRKDEALALCRAALAEHDGERWWGDQIVDAMTHADLTLAGDLAELLAAVQRGSEWYPAPVGPALPPLRADLSIGKLRHDAGQLRYLRACGAVPAELDDAIAALDRAAARLAAAGPDPRQPLDPDEDPALARVYGRLVHVASAPRQARALAPGWDRGDVQRRFGQPPGIVVIDDFLTPEALASLRRFCVESTVWARNRYGHSRLGSLFFDGFNAPLLLQLAEELRTALPDVIGSRYPLRQLWGFKNTEPLPADSTLHADFAAVNVNFWLTPDDANLDPSSGGMVIYDVDAPASWDFTRYNERADLIRAFLESRRARAIRVPYRQNRAIIFNSDLFHATEAVRFRADHASHRVNVTMLFGDRDLDRHHPPSDAMESSALAAPWRSAAFARGRRRP